MNRQKAPRRPAAGARPARGETEPWDERPAKKAKASRPDLDGFNFYEDAEFEVRKSPRTAPVKGAAANKPRGAALPFEEALFRDARAERDAYDGAPARGVRGNSRPAAKPRAASRDLGDEGIYEGAPPRKPRAASRVRAFDDDFGYAGVPPVRKARAQRPRPMEDDRYGRFPRDDDYHDDRPSRRTKGRKRKKTAGGGALLYWAAAVVLALIIGFGVRTFGFELVKVNGDAMNMTLTTGETVLIEKHVYYSVKPARGDIVGVNSPDGLMIRRVVALPGETIQIKGGFTFVNDEQLDEPYVFQKALDDYPLTTIPDGCYFVMGDNRVNTDDSRAFGLVKNTRSLIVGKVTRVVWPLDLSGEIK